MDVIKSVIGILGAALIVGLVELAKPFIKDTRLYPLIAVGWGLIINIVAAYALGTTSFPDLFAAVIMGLMAGHAASGMYSDSKTFKGN